MFSLFLYSYSRFGLLALRTFKIILHFNHLIISAPYEGYSRIASNTLIEYQRIVFTRFASHVMFVSVNSNATDTTKGARTVCYSRVPVFKWGS